MKRKKFFSYFNESEELIKFSVKYFLELKDQDIIYRTYGENLDKINNNLLTSSEIHKSRTLIVNKVFKILCFLESNGISEEDISSLENNKNVRDKLVEEFKSHDVKGCAKKLITYFDDKEYIILRLAVEMLEESDRDLIYKKYGNDLNCVNTSNLSLVQKNRLSRTLIIKIAKIISALEEMGIDKEKASFLLNNKSKLDKLRIELEETGINKGEKTNNFFSYFKNESKSLVKLSVKFLDEEDQTFLYDIYTKELDKVLYKNKDYNNKYKIIKKVNDVIEDLKSKNIDEEKAYILLNDKTKLESFISENKGSILQRKYASYRSIFDVDKSVMRLAIYFLNDKKRDMFYKRYGVNLEEFNKLTDNESKYFYACISPKVKDIISFLEKFGITEEKANEILKSNEKIEELIREYNAKRTKNLISILKDVKMLRLALCFLDNETLDKVIRICGENYDKDLKNLKQEEKKQVNNIIIEIKKIILFLNNNSINSKNVDSVLKDEEKINELKITYNKGNYQSLFSYFDAKEYLVRLSVLFLDSSFKVVLYNKYGVKFDDNTFKDYFSNADEVFFEKRVVPKMRKIISFLKGENLSEEYVLDVINTFDTKEINILKNKYKCFLDKQKNIKKDILSNSLVFASNPSEENLVRLAIQLLNNEERELLFKTFADGRVDRTLMLLSKIVKLLKLRGITSNDAYLYLKNPKDRVLSYLRSDIDKIRNNSNLYLDEGESIFSYFEDSKERVVLSLMFLTNGDKNIIYKRYGSDLKSTFPLNKDNYLRVRIIPEINNILKFLRVRNISDEMINYLLSSEGLEDVKLLINSYNMEKNMKNLIFSELKKLSNSEEYTMLEASLGSDMALGILAIENYGYSLTVDVISDIVNVNIENLTNAYRDYKNKNKLTL